MLRRVACSADGAFVFATLRITEAISSGSPRGTISSLLNDMAERVGDVFVSALEEAGYDSKAASIYANALVGMVIFVGTWWTDERKPAIEEVAKHISALAWMGLRHLPRRPTLRGRPD